MFIGLFCLQGMSGDNGNKAGTEGYQGKSIRRSL
jgi:hypothetical protein